MTTTARRTAARVVGAVKVYGGGDTAVHALDSVDVDLAPGSPRPCNGCPRWTPPWGSAAGSPK